MMELSSSICYRIGHPGVIDSQPIESSSQLSSDKNVFEMDLGHHYPETRSVVKGFAEIQEAHYRRSGGR